MSDLISRSALVEALLQKKSLMAEIVGGRHPIAMESVIEYIENFQCAYNVDKVVEQLEEMRSCEDAGFCNHCQNTWCPLELLDADEAIEIVRKGGVD